MSAFSRFRRLMVLVAAALKNMLRSFRYFVTCLGLFAGVLLFLLGHSVRRSHSRLGSQPDDIRDTTELSTDGEIQTESEQSYPLKHISTVYTQIKEDIRVKYDTELDRLLATSTSSKRLPGRKNVLFIMSDDLRPQLGSYRGRHYPNPFTDLRPHTPHLDRLAASSLLLTRAYVQYPLCGPSRASMLTGRRPDTVTSWKLGTQFREVGRNFTTLPEYFKNNGYLSINLGKIFHQGHGWKADLPSWKIDEPNKYYPQVKLYMDNVLSKHKLAGMITSDQRQGQMLTPDESLTQNALNYLRRLAPAASTGNISFFLAVGYHRPHLPWICSREFFDLYPKESIELPREENKYHPKNYPVHEYEAHVELIKAVLGKDNIKPFGILPDNETLYYRRAYFACVSFVDDMVGILLDEVDKLGLADSTIVMFLGDHGWHLGENGLWGKRTTFEQSNHTPLMMKIPGVTDEGIVSDSLVEFIDIFPTLVEAVGLPPLPRCPRHSHDIPLCTEGTSFLPLLKNPRSVIKNAALSQVLTKRSIMRYSIRTDRYRYIAWVPMSGTVVDKNMYDYHLQWQNISAVELYDHEFDPEENVNLAEEASLQDVIYFHQKLLRNLVPTDIRNVRISLFKLR